MERKREKYGCLWPAAMNDFSIELQCFAMGHPQEEGGLGKVGHAREIIQMLWGKHNDRQHYVFNPWSDKMLEEACQQKYLAVSGCANATKSDTFAVWALINAFADPLNTMVLVTSTSLKESRGRIWGRLEDYFLAAQHVTGNGLPFKLVSSIGLIRFEDPTGTYKTSDRCGIHLIAGEKKKEKEAVGKMIGLKQKRVFFIADELPELSHAILEAAFGNLAANPYFQLVGIGNPASVYDAHGSLSRPQNGWGSVTIDDEEWETEKGYHIRFDALKSPNVLAGRTIYKFLPTVEKIEAAKHDTGGEDSPAFFRMWRAWWHQGGGNETVVSEADIIKYACEENNFPESKNWPEFSALDPAFTSKGDRSMATFAKLGTTNDGKQILLFTGSERIDPDVSKKDLPHNQQVVLKWREICEKRRIPPERTAYDNTGAAAFGDIVTMCWSRLCTPINFGGKASELRISANDKTRACDKFVNRVTEIGTVIREYIRSNQIKGITFSLGQELTSRRMKHKKDGGLKQQIETKEDYRARVGRSPDEADSFHILLDFLRSRYHFRALERVSRIGATNTSWRAWVQKNDRFANAPTLNRAA